jgi:hypothetical protein
LLDPVPDFRILLPQPPHCETPKTALANEAELMAERAGILEEDVFECLLPVIGAWYTFWRRSHASSASRARANSRALPYPSPSAPDCARVCSPPSYVERQWREYAGIPSRIFSGGTPCARTKSSVACTHGIPATGPGGV